jgi:enterochelin esterase family protein
MFYGVSRWGSGVEVPAQDEDFYAVKNVPHGQLREVHYFSKTANATLQCYVYTPPEYEKGSKRYPVLYLQHGAGENEYGWGTQGHAGYILDNLLAAGKAKPFLIVIGNSSIPGAGGGRGAGRGRGEAPAGAPLAAAGPGQAPAGAPGAAGRGAGAPGGRGGTNPSAFENVLINDTIPFIDANFRTLADQPHRAMAGLSMGGMQTFITTLGHLDSFAYIGGFSPGLPQSQIETIYKDPAAFNKQVKLLWIGTGTVERDSNPNILRLHEALDKAGVNNVYFESQGTAHEWLTWRRSLNDFAPRLFQ